MSKRLKRDEDTPNQAIYCIQQFIDDLNRLVEFGEDFALATTCACFVRAAERALSSNSPRRFYTASNGHR